MSDNGLYHPPEPPVRAHREEPPMKVNFIYEIVDKAPLLSKEWLAVCWPSNSQLITYHQSLRASIPYQLSLLSNITQPAALIRVISLSQDHPMWGYVDIPLSGLSVSAGWQMPCDNQAKEMYKLIFPFCPANPFPTTLVINQHMCAFLTTGNGRELARDLTISEDTLRQLTTQMTSLKSQSQRAWFKALKET